MVFLYQTPAQTATSVIVVFVALGLNKFVASAASDYTSAIKLQTGQAWDSGS